MAAKSAHPQYHHKPEVRRKLLALFTILGEFAGAGEHVPTVTTEGFAAEVERVLPREESFAYHKRLSAGPETLFALPTVVATLNLETAVERD